MLIHLPDLKELETLNRKYENYQTGPKLVIDPFENFNAISNSLSKNVVTPKRNMIRETIPLTLESSKTNKRAMGAILKSYSELEDYSKP